MIEEKITEFSPDVCKKIGYYVYRLVDPRNGQTFYVGKGRGNRVFNHVHDAEKIYDEAEKELKKEYEESKNNVSTDEIEKNLKISTINDIKNAGLEVIHIIQRWGIETESEAFLVEAAVMDCYSGLTNRQSGHYSSDFGVINAVTLQANQSVKEFEEPDNIEEFMIIKVRQESVESMGGRYDATRCCWRVTPANARKHPYVLSVTDGIVEEIYYAENWEEITNGADAGRYQFNGRVVEDKNIRDRFYHKRIPDKYTKKGMASPFLYCKK